MDERGVAHPVEVGLPSAGIALYLVPVIAKIASDRELVVEPEHRLLVHVARRKRISVKVVFAERTIRPPLCLAVRPRKRSIKHQPLVFRQQELRVQTQSVVPSAGPIPARRGRSPRIPPLVARERSGHLVEHVPVVCLDANRGAVLEILPDGGIRHVQVIRTVLSVAIRSHVVVGGGVLHSIHFRAAFRLHIASERALRSGLAGYARLPFVVSSVGDNVYDARDRAIAVQHRAWPVDYLHALHASERDSRKVGRLHLNRVKLLAIHHHLHPSE